MSLQPVFPMSDIFLQRDPDFLRDILMQAWLCLAVLPHRRRYHRGCLPLHHGRALVTVGSVALALGMGLVLGVPMADAAVYGNAWHAVWWDCMSGFPRRPPSWCLSFFPRGFFLSMGWIVSPSCRRHGLHQHGLPVPDLPGRHRGACPQGRSRPHAPWACAT